MIWILLTAFLVWLIYEVWRAPMVKEEEDGSVTYLERPKRFRNIFRLK